MYIISKALISAILFLLTSLLQVVHAEEKIALQLRWVPQAQFAGYYVAEAKGYYKKEGLDVTILPGGPNINVIQALLKNNADIGVSHLSAVLVARESGAPLVNIAQIFNRAGIMLACKKSSGVNTTADLKGKTLGVWFSGTEASFFTWMNKLGYKPDEDIKVFKQDYSVEPLIDDKAACISAMVYNEYLQIIDAGIKEKELTTFFYEDQGVAMLEDGLYVSEGRLKDPAFVARMGKFLRATIKGWNYAVKNVDEAAQIVVSADKSGKSNFKFQKRQLQNVSELVTYANSPKMGYLEQSAYERTVKVMLTGGANPLLKKNPGDSAFSRAVWDAAQK
jgi:NitT/TauT family transport system substrate-binding protein